MRKFYMIGLVSSLCLAACNPGTVAPPASNSTTPAPSACAVTADAMYAAEAAYNVPAHAYVTADATPALAARFAPIKASVKPKLVAAYDALKKARLFYSAGDAAFCGAVAEVKSNADQANALIPK